VLCDEKKKEKKSSLFAWLASGGTDGYGHGMDRQERNGKAKLGKSAIN